jgi:hypothetical protein
MIEILALILQFGASAARYQLHNGIMITTNNFDQNSRQLIGRARYCADEGITLK